MDHHCRHNPDSTAGLLELSLGHCGCFFSLDTPQGGKDTTSSTRGDQQHMAKELFNKDVGVLTYCTLRNKEFQEVTLERDVEVLLRFKAVYGFQNIQKWS
ncbi:Nuclear prelamin A recognition factor [Myotis brandtii]|uniref:Nuclear prelamin A recognition factor n=1 Tax=Myotis brandtii TaxID=109478 RepID=S7NL50_MYOBR|nr:Nuclear prelamin A recognition factor [Myotis brandtii]